MEVKKRDRKRDGKRDGKKEWKDPPNTDIIRQSPLQVGHRRRPDGVAFVGKRP